MYRSRRFKKSILRHGYSWGGTTPMWEEESEDLIEEMDEIDELEELRERSEG